MISIFRILIYMCHHPNPSKCFHACKSNKYIIKVWYTIQKMDQEWIDVCNVIEFVN